MADRIRQRVRLTGRSAACPRARIQQESVHRCLRWAALNLMGEGDLVRFESAHALFLELILRQQILDVSEGRPPGTQVAANKLHRPFRRRLKAALRDIAHLPQLVLDVAAHG